MASSIEATFGLGLEPWTQGLAKIETDAQRLDENLKKVGITLGEAPKKLAEESSKAFEEIYAGEAKLADYRSKLAFDRLSDEQKMQVLVQESLELREKAGEIEGRSVEKSEMLLEAEKKRQQAVEIGQRVQQRVTAELEAQKRAQEQQVAQQKTLNEKFNEFAIALKKVGLDLGRGFGLAIAVNALKNEFKAALNEAQRLRDTSVETGSAIEQSTLALARTADVFDSLRGVSVAVFGTIAEGVQKAVIGLSAYVVGTDVAADALNRLEDATDGVIKKEKELGRVRDENSPEKIQAAESKLAEFRRNQAFERADIEGKINMLLSEQSALLNEQNKVGKDTVRFSEIQLQLEQKGAQIAEIRTNAEQLISTTKTKQKEVAAETLPIETQQEKTANQRASAEARITAEKQKQAQAAEVAAKTAEISAQANKGGFDFQFAKDESGNVKVDKNGNPIVDPHSVTPANGAMFGSAGFGKGAMQMLGGRRTFDNDAQQRAEDAMVLESTMRDIDTRIYSLNRALRELGTNSSQAALATRDQIQAEIGALQNRRSNARSYAFDPNYMDVLGQGILGQQRSANDITELREQTLVLKDMRESLKGKLRNA